MNASAATTKQPCTVCGRESTAPLCWRAECLEKWKAMMKEAPKS